MSSITIRGCCIGAGRPKVILPIVARTEDDILREAQAAVRAEGRLHRVAGRLVF